MGIKTDQALAPLCDLDSRQLAALSATIPMTTSQITFFGHGFGGPAGGGWIGGVLSATRYV